MKNLIIINGAPGMGKTTISEELLKILPNSIYLDCDCFMTTQYPFRESEETIRILHENIAFAVNNYLRCTEYQNIVVNWVFISQSELDSWQNKNRTH